MQTAVLITEPTETQDIAIVVTSARLLIGVYSEMYVMTTGVKPARPKPDTSLNTVSASGEEAIPMRPVNTE